MIKKEFKSYKWIVIMETILEKMKTVNFPFLLKIKQTK